MQELLLLQSFLVGAFKEVYELEDSLHCRHHHGSVGVLQSGHYSLDNRGSFIRRVRVVSRDSFQDVDLAPFIRVIQGGKEFIQITSRPQLDIVLVGGLRNFQKRRTNIGNYNSISIPKHPLEHLDQIIVLDQPGRSLVKFGDRNGCCFLDIGVLVR